MGGGQTSYRTFFSSRGGLKEVTDNVLITMHLVLQNKTTGAGGDVYFSLKRKFRIMLLFVLLIDAVESTRTFYNQLYIDL